MRRGFKLFRKKINFLSVYSLVKVLKRSEYSSKDVCKFHLNFLKKTDHKLNSVSLYGNSERVFLNQAVQSDKRRFSGLGLSSFDGIPVSIKSNMLKYDCINDACSDLISNKVWLSSKLTSTLSRLGFLIYTKSNSDDFAMGSKTQSKRFGEAYNPWNLYKTPGGSSGGAAASISSKQQFIAFGSDTGGSVRQPASMCNIVGFKPSYGLISRFGLIPFSSSLDHIGLLGSNVVDIKILFELVSEFDINDSGSRLANTRKHAVKFDLINCDVAFFKNSNSFKNPFLKKINFLVKLKGFNLVELKLEALYDLTVPLYYIISSIEAVSNFNKYKGVFKEKHKYVVNENYYRFISNFRSSFFSSLVKYRLFLGEVFIIKDFNFIKKRILYLKNKLTRYLSTLFTKVNFLIIPTLVKAPNFSSFDKDMYTVISNIVGFPAISIPFIKKTVKCFSSVQVIGGKFSDSKLLQFAFSLERFLTIM